MRVMAVVNNPAVLDLVAHFLGIATHHNINAAPTGLTAPRVTLVKGMHRPARTRLAKGQVARGRGDLPKVPDPHAAPPLVEPGRIEHAAS